MDTWPVLAVVNSLAVISAVLWVSTAIHELGHAAAMRLYHFSFEEIAIGSPELFSIKRPNLTIKFGPLPNSGYVKIDPKNWNKHAANYKASMVVHLAGPLASTISSAALYALVALLNQQWSIIPVLNGASQDQITGVWLVDMVLHSYYHLGVLGVVQVALLFDILHNAVLCLPTTSDGLKFWLFWRFRHAPNYDRGHLVIAHYPIWHSRAAFCLLAVTLVVLLAAILLPYG